MEQSAGASCAEAVLDEDLPAPGTVTAAHVYGQWAQVRLSGDTAFLAAFPFPGGGCWSISRSPVPPPTTRSSSATGRTR